MEGNGESAGKDAGDVGSWPAEGPAGADASADWPEVVGAGLSIPADFPSVASPCPAAEEPPPQADIERIRGAWSNINDDLGRFRATVADAIAATSPFIASLDLDVAAAEWAEVARGARQFAQLASAF